MLITAYNPPTDEFEKSYLTQSYAVGTTAIAVANNNKFNLNDRIMIGEMGQEKTEIVTVNAAVTAGEALTVGATVFAHSVNEPVTVLRFDQVKIYRSDTSDGTYTLLDTVALDVDNADLTTSYDDTTGTSSQYYEVSYYHSISTLESEKSDPMKGSGYLYNQVGYLIDEVLREIRDPQEQTTDKNTIINDINECSNDLMSRVSRPYSFLHQRTTLSTVASTETVDFPTNSDGSQKMWKFDRINFLYNDGTDTIVYPVRVIPAEEFDLLTQDQAPTEDDKLQLVALDTSVNKFRLYPMPDTSLSGVIYLHYWKRFATIDSSGDTFETPTNRVYKLYCLFKHYRRKSESDATFRTLASDYQADYEREAARLPQENRKDSGSPRGMTYRPQDHKGWRKY